MKNTTVLKVVNPALAVLALNQPFSVLLYSLTKWKAFETMHVGGGVLLLLFAAIHLMLNWNWVQMNFLKDAKKNKTKGMPQTPP